LTKWWKGLQPSWRDQGDGNLSRDIPTGENWVLLRKGGTAGIYTVIIALSWWIKDQATQRDADSWIFVNDLTWVIHQMFVTGSGSGALARPKRAREADEADEAKQRFTKRCILFSQYSLFIMLKLFHLLVVILRSFCVVHPHASVSVRF
jgi:hypothetical protein